MTDNQTKTGTIIGMLMGAVESAGEWIGVDLITVIENPWVDLALKTILGASVGFLITKFWRWLWPEKRGPR